MEVKINREIRSYTESMFFGLSMRQFIFSVLAVGVAVGLYFLLRPRFGVETVSWMCILGAICFAGVFELPRHDGGAVSGRLDTVRVSGAENAAL